MASHQWVTISVTPTQVLIDPEDDSTVAFTTEEDEAAAKEESVMGCAVCDEPLNDVTSRQPCMAIS